jgi:hypothetical protein
MLLSGIGLKNGLKLGVCMRLQTHSQIKWECVEIKKTLTKNESRKS